MIRRILTGRELNLMLRLLLGGMFLYAASDKIMHPQEFAISVRAYQILPVSLSNLFAVVVPWTEALAGAMLIAGVFVRSAAGALFWLLLTFTVAITTVVARGMVVDCGCFDADGGSAAGPLLIVRNVLLLCAAYLVLRFNDGFLTMLPRRGGPAPVTE